MKIDMNARTSSSTNSSVSQPKIHDIIVTICLPLSEKMAETYGGASLGMCCSSTMKVWNNWARFDEINLVYFYNKYPIESAVWFGLGWTCNISLIDLALMVNKTFWSGDIIVLWLGM